jgi:adenylate cyclase
VRTRRQRRLRGTAFLAVGLAMCGLALTGYGFGFLDNFERDSLDVRFDIRGPVSPLKNIVLVKMDDVTFDELGVQWPFRRSLHAKVIDRIAADQPKAIGYDIQFTEATTLKDDNTLIDAVDRAHNVVLVTTEVDNGHTRIFGGDDVLASIGARPASALLPADDDGVIRKVDYEVDGLRTLAIVLADAARGRPVKRGDFGDDGAWIAFAGPAGTFPAWSFSRVLNGKVPSGTFRDKIVLVGPTAPTLHDQHATPTDGLMPGVEIQANALATALRGAPLRSAPAALNIALILALGLLAPAVSLRNRPLITLPVAALAAAVFCVGIQLAFQSGMIISFVYPLAALALSTVAAIGIHSIVSAFERERVRDLFSRFVPEQVVDDVLARTDSDLRLGGTRVEATVLFSDLRDFTAVVENLPAERVIEVLNHYLGEMSDAILAHGGTLVSYMGDGIMAVFGAPIEQEDHAERAFAAAYEMLQERLPRFNEWCRDHGIGDGFKMGLGLNSGPLMTGNVGHARRLEYTAVGDTTNTASRVEQLTKGRSYSMFVAGSTQQLLPAEAAARLVFVEEAAVRGRRQTLPIFGLALESPSAGLAEEEGHQDDGEGDEEQGEERGHTETTVSA